MENAAHAPRRPELAQTDIAGSTAERRVQTDPSTLDELSGPSEESVGVVGGGQERPEGAAAARCVKAAKAEIDRSWELIKGEPIRGRVHGTCGGAIIAENPKPNPSTTQTIIVGDLVAWEPPPPWNF